MSRQNKNKKKKKIEAKPAEPKTLKFYHFNQNNSGGGFDDDENVSYNVFIQAYSADEANDLAESKAGIYFDGADEEDGRDCPCCGSRWYRASDRDGTDEPEIYGKKLSEVEPMFFSDHSVIYYYDGRKEKIMIDVKDRRSESR